MVEDKDVEEDVVAEARLDEEERCREGCFRVVVVVVDGGRRW